MIREKTHHYASRVPSAGDQPTERPVAGCFGICVERLRVELSSEFKDLLLRDGDAAVLVNGVGYVVLKVPVVNRNGKVR